jgi:hypothetical protein
MANISVVKVGVQGPAGSGLGTHEAEAQALTHVRVVTSATRPASPIEGQIIYETDTNKLLWWQGAAWVPFGPHAIVTSTTRPVTPFEGQSIYETDTDRGMVYNGTIWIPDGSGKTPMVRVRRAAAQSIANSTDTLVTFDAQDYDNTDMWVVGSATRITIQMAGVYSFLAVVQWAANSTGSRKLAFWKNGANVGETQQEVGPTTYGNMSAYEHNLAVSDFIEIKVTQFSGAALNLTSAVLTAHYIGQV